MIASIYHPTVDSFTLTVYDTASNLGRHVFRQVTLHMGGVRTPESLLYIVGLKIVNKSEVYFFEPR